MAKLRVKNTAKKKVKKKAKKRKIKTKKNPKKFPSESVNIFVLRDQKTGEYYTSNFTNATGPLEEAQVYPSKANAVNCQADYSDIVQATLTTKK